MINIGTLNRYLKDLRVSHIRLTHATDKLDVKIVVLAASRQLIATIFLSGDIKSLTGKYIQFRYQLDNGHTAVMKAIIEEYHDQYDKVAKLAELKLTDKYPTYVAQSAVPHYRKEQKLETRIVSR